MSNRMDRSLETESLRSGEPTWEIAHLFPAQGAWSESEYLGLNTNHLVEYSNGFVEFLPMPTLTHQLIAQLLCRLLEAFVAQNGLGTVVGAPYKVKLWEGKFREPDVVFMLAEHAVRLGEQYADGADLVMEVVSDEGRRRDVETKLRGICPRWHR